LVALGNGVFGLSCGNERARRRQLFWRLRGAVPATLFDAR